MILLTQYIAKHELQPLIRYLSLNEIIFGARKVAKGLAVSIKSPGNVSGLFFFKVRVGRKNDARMIVFVKSTNNTIVPLLIRLKKDKLFGMNMSMNNALVVTQLKKNLEHVLDDIQAKRYQECDI